MTTNQMHLFDGPGAEHQIKSMLETAEWVRIAVPYWGRDAANRLGLAKLRTKDVKIVCDLASGGCDPQEIRTLQHLFGGENVRTSHRLHAKVWQTDSCALFGSSNASTNGFGVEGTAAELLIELNAASNHPETLKFLKDWFDRRVIPASREIEPADFRLAEERHRQRRNSAPLTGQTVLDVAMSDPEIFERRDVYVWVWKHSELDEWAHEILNEARGQRANKNIDAYQEVKNLRPGAYVLDFDLTAPSISFEVWQVLRDSPLVRKRIRGKMRSILLCIEVTSVQGLPLGDRRIWKRAARRAAANGKEEWTLADFARRFLARQG